MLHIAYGRFNIAHYGHLHFLEQADIIGLSTSAKCRPFEARRDDLIAISGGALAGRLIVPFANLVCFIEAHLPATLLTPREYSANFNRLAGYYDDLNLLAVEERADYSWHSTDIRNLCQQSANMYEFAGLAIAIGVYEHVNHALIAYSAWLSEQAQ